MQAVLRCSNQLTLRALESPPVPLLSLGPACFHDARCGQGQKMHLGLLCHSVLLGI